ncbi:MAG: hypothetical protein QXM27_00270 [Candidatus Pacearchaeota archaeon]
MDQNVLLLIEKILVALFNTTLNDINFLALCGIVFICFVIWFYRILKDISNFPSFIIFLISIFLPFLLFQIGLAKIIEFFYKISPILAFFIIVLFFFSSSILEYLTMNKIRKGKKLKELLEEEKGKAMLKEFGKMVEK